MIVSRSRVLEISAVSASYGPVRALDDVSVHVCEGEIVAVIGANGAGKSSLLMSIFGLPRVRSGSIRVCGEDVTRLPTEQVAARKIAIAPEGRRIFPGMTVEENLLLGATPIGDATIRQDYARMVSLFPVLAERSFQRAGTLSGGEQQMVSIARALMSRPKVLLLDEPSLGLAPLIIRGIFETLRQIAAEGTAILLVEQNAHEALAMANRGYVMASGQITLSGTGAELRNNPSVVDAYLG